MPRGRSNSSGQDILGTIEAIHAAAVDPSVWPRALEALTRTLGAQCASFELFDKQASKHLEFHSYAIPKVDEIDYFEHYMVNNPRWLHMPKQRTGEVGWDLQFIDEKGMDHAPFYAELLARMDLRYFLSGVIDVTADRYACVSVQRASRVGHVDKSEIRLMQTMLPHVQQAFDVMRRLREAQRRNAAFERVFDWLDDGVAIVSDAGQVTYTNTALQGLLRQKGGVRLRAGVLEFTAAAAQGRFEAALGRVRKMAAGDNAFDAPADFAVSQGTERPPYVVSVRRLAADPLSDARGAALVFIRDPLAQSGTTTAIVQDTYGLTAAEAKVALLIQAGVALEDQARRGGVSLNTIYTHLRRIREKTGARSLAELTAKLNALLVPLKADR